MSVFKRIYPLSLIAKNEIYVIVPPNSTYEAFRFKVPRNSLFYLQVLKIDKWYPNTEILIYMDGELIYKYTRVGEYKYDPPYVIINEFKIVVRNMTNEEKPFGFFIDGLIEERT